MKNIFSIGLTALCLLAIPSATFAQLGNFDYFATPKTLQVTPAEVLSESAGTTLVSSNVFNASRFDGIVVMDIASVYNSGQLPASFPFTNAWTLLQSSNGSNAWTQVTNAFFAVSTSVISSNLWGTTNSQVLYYTNTFQVPGVLTAPVVGVNGFSGQYVVPAWPTNYASAGATNSANWTIGFDVGGFVQSQVGAAGNLGNFYSLQWTTGGSNAVYSVSAVLRGRTRGGVY